MVGLAARIDALTDAELAGNLSRIDLSVLLIDCGRRIALARSLVSLAKALDPDALTAGADA
jgi:hypothetical protein